MSEIQTENQKLIRLASKASVSSAFLLIAIKVVGFSLTSSVAILASLIDSVVDSLSSILLFVAILYAQRPANDKHHFGHGKAETLGALAQTIFIGVSLVMLSIHAVDRILNPVSMTHETTGIVLMVISTMITVALVIFQKHVIGKTQSKAIEADSLHYLTDVLMNVAVIIGIVLVSMGYNSIDAYIALGIAIYISKETLGVAKESIQNLMDRSLEDDIENRITEIALSHPEVKGIHELRTRQAGQTAFVQLHIELDADMSLKNAHDIADDVEEKICAHLPGADVLIHQDPV